MCKPNYTRLIVINSRSPPLLRNSSLFPVLLKRKMPANKVVCVASLANRDGLECFVCSFKNKKISSQSCMGTRIHHKTSWSVQSLIIANKHSLIHLQTIQQSLRVDSGQPRPILTVCTRPVVLKHILYYTGDEQNVWAKANCCLMEQRVGRMQRFEVLGTVWEFLTLDVAPVYRHVRDNHQLWNQTKWSSWWLVTLVHASVWVCERRYMCL